MSPDFQVPHRSCPVCNARSIEFVREWRDFHKHREWSEADPGLRLLLGRCTECRMVYVTNTDEVDMSNTKYIHHVPKREPKPQASPRLDYHRAQIDMLSKFVGPTARVMDYGAGYCSFLRAAQEKGYAVEGINPVIHASEWAERVLGIKVHAVFGVDFQPEQKYDLVVSDMTFEHLVHPREDMQQVREMLTDNGFAYIEVPNWQTIKRVTKGTDVLKDPMHYNYFTPHTLADLARRVGFTVLKKAPVVARTPSARIIKSVVNPMGYGTCSVLLAK